MNIGSGQVLMPIAVLGMLAVEGAVVFAIVYLAARLAIRHQRRSSS